MTRAAWAEAIGAELDEGGLPTPATIARHVRAAAASESFLLRSRILRALKESYAPFNCEADALGDAIIAVLDALVMIGDLTAFQTDGGAGFVSTPERLVDLGEDVAILGASQIQVEPSSGLVRRLPRATARSQTAAPLLDLADEIGLAEWRLHLVETGGLDAAVTGPSGLFSHLAGLAAGGERLERVGRDEVRALVGRGDYCGNPRALTLDGRWGAWDGQGTYCAVRKRPYGWQNCVLAATAEGPRVLDISDSDRWRWAIVGQTLASHDRVVTWNEGVYQSLTPPPGQIQRLLTLSGVAEGSWRWRVAEQSALLAAHLVGQTGY